MASNWKYTPGPWRTQYQGLDSNDNEYKYKLLAKGSGENLLSLPMDNSYNGQVSVLEANARLMAMSPEMLQALRDISKGEGRFSSDQLEHANNTIYDMKSIAFEIIEKCGG